MNKVADKIAPGGQGSARAGAPAIKVVGAVTATMEILRYLSAAQAPLRVSQISRALGLNNSTCFNILRTLELERVVKFDASSKLYTLGQGLIDLVLPMIERDDGGRRFARAMQAAAQDLGVTIAYWGRVGDELELLSVAESSETTRIAFTVGRRLPLFTGAMGRLMAGRSGASPDELAAGCSRIRWAKPPRLADWLSEVEASLRDRVACDPGNVHKGIVTLAVPVEPEGELHHALCATMFESGHSVGEHERIAERLHALADIARTLKGDTASPHAAMVYDQAV
jgi:DNA-binding IclR family transcriptional regulator